MKKSIAFIGAGNMGGAIAKRLLFGGVSVTVFEPDGEKCAKFAALGANIAKSAIEACEACDYILLAVKPQIIGSVLEGLKPVDFSGKVILTIAAGISTSFIESVLGRECAVVRIMPNTAVELGVGACAYSVNERVMECDRTEIAEMLASLGGAYLLDESKMNAVISVNGSSPAYFYYIMDAMFKSAKAQGLDCTDEELTHMIAMTLRGTADMMLDAIKTGKSFDDRIKEVTSPNGTTERAMNVLREENIHAIIDRAMRACTDRAEELSLALENKA